MARRKIVATLKYIVFGVTRQEFGALFYRLFCFQNKCYDFMMFEPDPDGGMKIMSYQ